MIVVYPPINTSFYCWFKIDNVIYYLDDKGHFAVSANSENMFRLSPGIHL